MMGNMSCRKWQIKLKKANFRWKILQNFALEKLTLSLWNGTHCQVEEKNKKRKANFSICIMNSAPLSTLKPPPPTTMRPPPILREQIARKRHSGIIYDQTSSDKHADDQYLPLLAGNVEVIENRVTVCRDAVKGTCMRPQCKYYHIPVALPPAPLMAVSASASP